MRKEYTNAMNDKLCTMMKNVYKNLEKFIIPNKNEIQWRGFLLFKDLFHFTRICWFKLCMSGNSLKNIFEYISGEMQVLDHVIFFKKL